MIANIEPMAGAKPVLKTEIEPAAQKFAAANQELTELVGELNDKIEALKRAWLPGIKKAVSKAAERHAELKTLIEANPGLFDKPRTVVLHGIKLGLQKGKGGIEFDDADMVIVRVQKLFGDQANAYLNYKVTPNKYALAQLPVNDLKKLGCTVRDTGDEVVIKPVDGDVDKIVRALLKDATEDAVET